MRLAQPIVTIACLLPLAYAWLVSRTVDPKRAHSFALFGAISTAVITAGVAAMHYASGDAPFLLEHSVPVFGSRVHYQMGVDALSAPLLVLIACVSLALILAGRRQELTPSTLAAMLATEGFTLGMFAARDLVLFTLCWIASLVPMNQWRRKHLPRESHARRMILLMSVGSSVPLVLAVAWLGVTDRVHDAAFDMFELHRHGVPVAAQTPIFVLVALAALIRMGIVPFHSWLPAIWRGATLPVAAMTVIAPAGVYLLARFGLPLLPHPATGRVPLIADLALVSAVYGSLLALAQKDLKRMLGALAISQSGLMLIGLASATAQGEAGALLLCVGDRVALCGLFLTVWLVRDRTGTTDMSSLGGLASTMPKMAGAFVVFALGSMGAPGTLGFVAEDLVVSGIIESYPWIAIIVVATTAINGITLLRAFSRVFLGPTRDPRVERGVLPDLSVHERWVTAALVAFLVTAGLFPGALTRSMERATTEMEPSASVTRHLTH